MCRQRLWFVSFVVVVPRCQVSGASSRHPEIRHDKSGSILEFLIDTTDTTGYHSHPCHPNLEGEGFAHPISAAAVASLCTGGALSEAAWAEPVKSLAPCLSDPHEDVLSADVGRCQQPWMNPWHLSRLAQVQQSHTTWQPIQAARPAPARPAPARPARRARLGKERCDLVKCCSQAILAVRLSGLSITSHPNINR